MPREEIERFLLPRPLLEHLRRRLDEVTRDARAREGRELRLAEQVMDDVTELVEEGDRVLVAHERGRGAARLRKVALDGADRYQPRTVRHLHGVADAEHGGVLVLAVARVEIEVEAAEHLA